MKTVTAEVAAPLFNAEQAKTDAIPKIKAGIKAPYVGCQLSTLGGQNRPTIMVTVSLDPKEKWSNGILQNSRYANLSLDHDGTVEHFSGDRAIPKIRKRKVKSVDDFIALVNKTLDSIPK